jgi:hypothetical protein
MPMGGCQEVPEGLETLSMATELMGRAFVESLGIAPGAGAVETGSTRRAFTSP